MSLDVIGYSERGMLDAICDDLLHCNGFSRLEQFLSWFNFPNVTYQPDFTGIRNAKIFVEQSFSDFGDLDLLILIDQPNRRQSVLIEAKVATANRSMRDGCLVREWENLLGFLDARNNRTSSLFVQLYRKFRLAEFLLTKIAPTPDSISRRYAIGANPVVHKAAAELSKYMDCNWFAAVIPDSPLAIERFAKSESLNEPPHPHQLPAWRMKEIGYLSWHTIKNNTVGWPQSTKAFAWNEEQVFGTFQIPTIALPAIDDPK